MSVVFINQFNQINKTNGKLQPSSLNVVMWMKIIIISFVHPLHDCIIIILLPVSSKYLYNYAVRKFVGRAAMIKMTEDQIMDRIPSWYPSHLTTNYYLVHHLASTSTFTVTGKSNICDVSVVHGNMTQMVIQMNKHSWQQNLDRNIDQS